MAMSVLSMLLKIPIPPSAERNLVVCADSKGLPLFAQLSWIPFSLGQSTHQHHVGIVVVVVVWLRFSECVALVLPETDVRTQE